MPLLDPSSGLVISDLVSAAADCWAWANPAGPRVILRLAVAGVETIVQGFFGVCTKLARSVREADAVGEQSGAKSDR